MSRLSDLPPKLLINPRRRSGRAYGEAESRTMSLADSMAAMHEIRTWPEYAPTPLIDRPALARQHALATFRVKHEGRRFAVGSFKALGPPYAALRLVAAEVALRCGRREGPGQLSATTIAAEARHIVLSAATSGNHGRALAWAARRMGTKCRIYMHEGVSQGRSRAIEAYGAEVRRVPGNFDDALRRCREDAVEDGAFTVADVADPRYPDVPRHTLHGYSVLAEELADQAPEATHVFVSAGNGTLASATIGRLWQRFGDVRPKVVIVEPTAADGAYRAAIAGGPAAVAGDLVTVMDGLAVGTVSPLAWPLLSAGADAFMAIPDRSAEEAMRIAATGTDGDPGLAVGETGIAAWAGAMVAARDPGYRARLGLGPNSQVVAIACEGATDPEVYRRLVGRNPSEVERPT
jgi:diaminopropionate ammonia-lyase